MLLLNRAKEATTTTGTGPVTLDGAVVPFQTWLAAGAVNGHTYAYLIEEGVNWEVGRGVYDSATDTLTRVLTASSSGALLNLAGTATIACVAAADQRELPRATFEHQVAAGTTDGGASTAGAWTKRTLNTTVTNEIGAGLAASVIALPAGTYRAMATQAMYRGNRTRSRLRDTTNNVNLLLSENQYHSNASNNGGLVIARGRFTLAAAANVELQYRVETAVATNGLGVYSNMGETEIYARVLLERLK